MSNAEHLTARLLRVSNLEDTIKSCIPTYGHLGPKGLDLHNAIVSRMHTEIGLKLEEMYTCEELEGLIAFYESEVGTKWANNGPILSKFNSEKIDTILEEEMDRLDLELM